MEEKKEVKLLTERVKVLEQSVDEIILKMGIL